MLLNDKDLRELLTKAPDILVPLRRDIDFGSSSSPIQPSSVDLTIGKIFVPPVEENQDPRVEESDYLLAAGNAAVVETRETLRMPADLAAFGFPPSKVSSNGLLMTNPGHIDPGYHGTLRFTIINMGRSGYTLQIGAPIVTLLFFSLKSPSEAPWSKRNVSQRSPVPSEVRRLPSSFLNIEERARQVAKDEVGKLKEEERKEERWAKVWGLYAPVSAALVVGILGLSNSCTGLSDLKERVTKVEAEIATSKAISELTKRIESLEVASKKQPSSTQPLPSKASTGGSHP
jgi:dCTP deaminase